jgi:hypothetical protein
VTVLTKTGNPEYWERIKRRLMEFCKPEDDIQCVRIFRHPDSTCQLCDYKPITWNHVLRNARTSKGLVVGSRCVHQYKVIIEEMGYDGTVDYLPKYHRAVEFINKRYPGTAKIISQEAWYDDEYRVEGYDWGDGYYGDPEDFDAYSLPAEGLSGYEIDWDSHDYE